MYSRKQVSYPGKKCKVGLAYGRTQELSAAMLRGGRGGFTKRLLKKNLST